MPDTATSPLRWRTPLDGLCGWKLDIRRNFAFQNWYPNASLANSADDSQPRITCEGRAFGRAQRAENYYLDRLTRYLYKMARILPCIADEARARARGHGYIVRSLIQSFEINVITPDCFIRVARASSFPRAIFGNICAAALANGSESCLWNVCRILTYVCRNIAAVDMRCSTGLLNI